MLLNLVLCTDGQFEASWNLGVKPLTSHRRTSFLSSGLKLVSSAEHWRNSVKLVTLASRAKSYWANVAAVSCSVMSSYTRLDGWKCCSCWRHNVSCVCVPPGAPHLRSFTSRPAMAAPRTSWPLTECPLRWPWQVSTGQLTELWRWTGWWTGWCQTKRLLHAAEFDCSHSEPRLNCVRHSMKVFAPPGNAVQGHTDCSLHEAPALHRCRVSLLEHSPRSGCTTHPVLIKMEIWLTAHWNRREA